jgi:hypothetical protein
MGRPTKYKAEFARQAAKLCTLGATDKELADFFEVNELTINRWKISQPGFCKSLKVGKQHADERVKSALYHRALGYSHPEDDIRTLARGDGISEIVITPTVKHYPPDTTACIFWLKNRLPEEFRANPDGAAAVDDMAAVLKELATRLPG